MASSDATEKDARRASTRGFGGYLLDRATGRADFKKAAAPNEVSARTRQIDKAEKDAVGYAAGGTAKAPSQASIRAYSKEYDMQSPAGRNVHEGRSYAKGGLVATQSRGFGKARRG